MLCASFLVLRAQNLQELYSLPLNMEKSYSTITTPIKYQTDKYISILSGTGAISTANQTITPRGENSILVLWNSKEGKMEYTSELGDNANHLSVSECILAPNGKVFVFGYTYFVTTKDVTIGDQTFSFRKDTLPNYFSGFFNLQTKQWEKVKFYYVGRSNNDNYMSNVQHSFDSQGNIIMFGTYIASYVIIDNDTIVKSNGSAHAFFVSKLDANFKPLWAKNADFLTNTSSVYNLTCRIDKNDNVYIAGGLGYITGTVSLDGVIVKNDTLLNTYDYTYTDLFLYKLNATGQVSYGKTYLFRGTEQVSDLIVRSDGNLYLCGTYNNEFSAPGETFTPTTNGEMFYNAFAVAINGTNGTFTWGKSIPGNLYYSNRFQQFRIDKNDNLYMAARFGTTKVVCGGTTFSKRTDNATAAQVLFAKFSNTGDLQWGRVLGSTTSYTDVIEHQLFRFWSIEDSLMFLGVPRQNYGSNTNFEWGANIKPDTSISVSMFGNTAIISLNSGNVKLNVYKMLDAITQIDSTDYFSIYSDFMSYDISRYTTKTVSISGTVFANGSPVTNLKYSTVELLSVLPANKGHIVAYALLDAQGNYQFTGVPAGGKYFIHMIAYDSTLVSSYYKFGVPAQWANADTVFAENSLTGKNIYMNKINYSSGSGTISGSINTGTTGYSCQVLLHPANNPANVVAYIIADYDYINNVYTYNFNAVPVGNYLIEVLYPFATSMEEMPATISGSTPLSGMDFKVVDKEIYMVSSPVSASIIEQGNEIIFKKSTQNIEAKSKSGKTQDFSIYSIQGLILFSAKQITQVSVSVANYTSGIYIVVFGNVEKKIVIDK